MLIKKAEESLRRSSLVLNHFSNYRHKLWLIGDGRSGTTWVSNLINYDKYFRHVFEPYHSKIMPEVKFLSSHYYARPAIENYQLYELSEKIFTGRLWYPRLDSDNAIGMYKGLLVKDIFANLFSYWVHSHFADVKIILLVRNPFAVAMSKYMKKDWTWITDPIDLFNQPDLQNDYLKEFEDLIFKTAEKNDFILNQILIWSIIHFIPFRQFNSEQIHLVFYEDIFLNPVSEISKIGNYVGIDLNHLSKRVIEKPSRVGSLNIQRGTSPITSWKSDIPVSTIDQGFRILESFGLHNLYDQNSIPCKFELDNF